jgi:TonB family protein
MADPLVTSPKTIAMRVCALLLFASLMALTSPGVTEARAAGGCPTSPAKIAQPPKLTLPEDSKITSKEIAFEIDLGSDGRVRALQMDTSSGDGAVDLLVQQTLQAATYDPPQTGCVNYSGGMRLAFSLPVDPAVSPAPSAKPGKLNTNCTPYVLAFLMPVARDRKRTGSATVAVELDAAGTETGPPVLRKSTGSPVLDQEAIRIARTGQYNFLRASSCAPQPFTYLLELTFT